MVNKITVVGAGNVGATTAQRVAEKELARTVVMVDVVEGIPQGKGLDQWQSAPIEGFDSPHHRHERLRGDDGLRHRHHHGRHRAQAGHVARRSAQHERRHRQVGRRSRSSKSSPNAIVIVVSNPLDVMCYVAKKVTGFPRERVIGMAGVLDTARYRAFLAEALDVSVRDIQAMVLGGHGDTMVPLISYTSVSGIPITQLMDKAKLDAIVDRTRNGGAEIVKHLKTGSAYYAPSAGAVQMAEAIVNDQRRILPCAAWLEGEYGMKDLFLGVPCKLGSSGLEKVIEVELTADERAALEKSAEAVREPMARRQARDAWTGGAELAPPVVASSRRRSRSMWALRLYRSTIGKKIIMAVTGLILVGFVIAPHGSATCRCSSGRRGSTRTPRSCRALGELLWIARHRPARRGRAARADGVAAHADQARARGRSDYAQREPQVSHARVAHDALGRRAAARLHRLPHPALHDGHACSRWRAGRMRSIPRSATPTSTATSSARSGRRGWRCSTSSRCSSSGCTSFTARGARCARSASAKPSPRSAAPAHRPRSSRSSSGSASRAIPVAVFLGVIR